MPRPASRTPDLGTDEARLLAWLGAGRHGEMHYMQRHGLKRSRAALLHPGTLRVVSVRMDYLPADAAPATAVLEDAALAYVSRYALGRDYHKLMRKRLQRLADRIEAAVGEFSYRVFTDSAPVLEKPLARAAGLGWIGKHTNLLNREAGSWFFLGEIYTDLGPARRRARRRSLRHLSRMHGRLPHRLPSSPPTNSTRGFAFPI